MRSAGPNTGNDDKNENQTTLTFLNMIVLK
jgi:hypothetical protein